MCHPFLVSCFEALSFVSSMLWLFDVLVQFKKASIARQDCSLMGANLSSLRYPFLTHLSDF